MKKLKLELVGKELLTKEQMKKITGGYNGTCVEWGGPCDPTSTMTGCTLGEHCAKRNPWDTYGNYFCASTYAC